MSVVPLAAFPAGAILIGVVVIAAVLVYVWLDK